MIAASAGPQPPASKHGIRQQWLPLASQLKKQQISLPQITVTDDVAPGLRALIRSSSVVAFHVSYKIGDTRPDTKIGELGTMSIDEARKVARTVAVLADQGIDPFANLVEDRVKDLQKQGPKWRP